MYVFGSGRGRRCVGDRIGFGLNQSCMSRGSVSVLRWCLGSRGVWVVWSRVWKGF